jgi:hypothetical protein
MGGSCPPQCFLGHSAAYTPRQTLPALVAVRFLSFHIRAAVVARKSLRLSLEDSESDLGSAFRVVQLVEPGVLEEVQKGLNVGDMKTRPIPGRCPTGRSPPGRFAEIRQGRDGGRFRALAVQSLSVRAEPGRGFAPPVAASAFRSSSFHKNHATAHLALWPSPRSSEGLGRGARAKTEREKFAKIWTFSESPDRPPSATIRTDVPTNLRRRNGWRAMAECGHKCEWN